jgi:cell division protein FtsB
MSPRKAATAKAAAPKAATAKAVVKKTSAKATGAKPAAPGTGETAANKTAANGTTSAEATALAARIERDLRDGRSDTLTPQAFQALMAALCKSYGTQLEAGVQFLPLASQTSASPTEVMTTTSALLKAANLAVFELGMWQSWTGR